jgi:hypothetical protein
MMQFDQPAGDHKALVRWMDEFGAVERHSRARVVEARRAAALARQARIEGLERRAPGGYAPGANSRD